MHMLWIKNCQCTILSMCSLVSLAPLLMLLLRPVFWGNTEAALELSPFPAMLPVGNVETQGNFHIGIHVYCGWNNMNAIDGLDNYLSISSWISIMQCFIFWSLITMQMFYQIHLWPFFFSVHNTLYLEVHCPVVKPTLVVISDNGKSTLDYGEVSLGQNIIKSVTIQNISNKTVEVNVLLCNKICINIWLYTCSNHLNRLVIYYIALFCADKK